MRCFTVTTLAQVASQNRFREWLVRALSWLSAVVAKISSPVEEEYPELSSVLRRPRGCSRGLAQKKAWIKEGVSKGLLLPSFPYISGSIKVLNYLSRSKVTVREDVFEEEKQKHAQVSASSSSAASHSVYQLPERVNAFAWDENKWRQKTTLVLENVRPRKTKLAFLDYHQVVDGAPRGTADSFRCIPRESVQQVLDLTDESGNFDVDLYIFILSYTRDRIETSSIRSNLTCSSEDSWQVWSLLILQQVISERQTLLRRFKTHLVWKESRFSFVTIQLT